MSNQYYVSVDRREKPPSEWIKKKQQMLLENQ